MLQAQVSTFQAAIPAALAAGSAAVVTFAVAPQTFNAKELLDYLIKRVQASMNKDARHSTTRHLLMALG
jgi:hypothetical protein